VADAPSANELYARSLHDALPISRSSARPMVSASAALNDPLRCPRPSNDRDSRASVAGGGGSGPSSSASAMSAQRRIAEIVSVMRSEEHTSELQSRENLVCRLPLE